MRDAATKCYQREGWRGFYKGLTPTLVKVIPAVAISCASSLAVVRSQPCGAGRSADIPAYACVQTPCTTRARSSCLRRSRRTTTMAIRTSRERTPIAACSRPGPPLSTPCTHGRRRSIPTLASFAARPLSPSSLRRRRLHRPALLRPASCRPLLSPSSPLHRPHSSHPLLFSLAISRLAPPPCLPPFLCSSRLLVARASSTCMRILLILSIDALFTIAIEDFSCSTDDRARESTRVREKHLCRGGPSRRVGSRPARTICSAALESSPAPSDTTGASPRVRRQRHWLQAPCTLSSNLASNAAHEPPSTVRQPLLWAALGLPDVSLWYS